MHKTFTIILYITQVIQKTSLLETRPKIVFDIGYDHFTLRWPSYFLSMLYICKGLWIVESTDNNLNKISPSKIIDKNWTFWKGILSWSKFYNSLKVCLGSTMARKQETTNWILLTELEGCGDNWVMNWGIFLGDFVDKWRAIKLSLEEKSNNSMKIEDPWVSEHWRKVWLTSFPYFTNLTI